VKVHLLPIEPLEERYSSDWLRWWPRELEKAGLEVSVVMGKRLYETLKGGEFLDPIDTHFFKSTQLAELCQAIADGGVGDDDVVLMLDAWNPTVTALGYIRDTIGPSFKIAGVFHAGTWDPHDYLTKTNMSRWANHVELGWFKALDIIFVATEFHAKLLRDWGCPSTKIKVTGLSLFPDCVTYERSAMMSCKARRVVFPHRLAQEKQPDVFMTLARLYRQKYPEDGTEWVRTKDVCSTKDEYYDLLALSKVAVSTALQETWGIAMIEATLLGCWPVAPLRLSYPETLGVQGFDLYESNDRAVELIKAGLDAPDLPKYDNTPWESAIRKVAKLIGAP